MQKCFTVYSECNVFHAKIFDENSKSSSKKPFLKDLFLHFNLFYCSKSTDYGRPERKKPSLHGRKFTPTPKFLGTGKSWSEALIFASTNPQYDDKLFIVHENCKLRIPAEHVVYTSCFCFVLTFRTILVHNMFCTCCELLKKIYL